jgi:hypothetical protein
MAENKYARMAEIAQQYQATEPDSNVETLPPKVGRPRGKSTNPEFERLTALVRTKTRKTAQRLWEDLEPKKDMSDLVEKLLAEWIEKQSA